MKWNEIDKKQDKEDNYERCMASAKSEWKGKIRSYVRRERYIRMTQKITVKTTKYINTKRNYAKKP